MKPLASSSGKSGDMGLEKEGCMAMRFRRALAASDEKDSSASEMMASTTVLPYPEPPSSLGTTLFDLTLPFLLPSRLLLGSLCFLLGDASVTPTIELPLPFLLLPPLRLLLRSLCFLLGDASITTGTPPRDFFLAGDDIAATALNLAPARIRHLAARIQLPLLHDDLVQQRSMRRVP
eukprot:CAMPEP_0196209198 /NCGR_PEP_ID=MMETSP0912-20130531/9511_1 /TAXON_ID=49265 /ORGANISM="Thalassiosira rotula, Strain GSO102" /LENGTH=176 /DNA_ID=CAMNT_0041484087 /DNA_START=162 /DNA_END=687 /DNA_ORIENTATION=-